MNKNILPANYISADGQRQYVVVRRNDGRAWNVYTLDHNAVDGEPFLLFKSKAYESLIWANKAAKRCVDYYNSQI